MSAGTRRPDHGVPDQCAAAGERIGQLDGALRSSRLVADALVDSITAAVWAGRSAEAFHSTAATIDQQAGAVEEAWGRLRTAVDGYATALDLLQQDGDRIRTRLTGAEEQRTYLLTRLAQATADRQAGDATAPARIASLEDQIADEDDTIRRGLDDLDLLADARTALDRRTAAELDAAPGPGTDAWSAVAFGANGSVRPTEQVVDDLLDRFAPSTTPTEADYALLWELLTLCSADGDTMAAFYDRLGAAGLAGLIARFATTDALPGALPGTAGTADLSALLAAGLATASRTWDTATSLAYGRALIDSIGCQDASMVGYAESLVVPYLLATDGLAPEVALGALERLEEVRVTDPDRFAVLTRTGGLPDLDLPGYSRDRYDASVLASLGVGSVDLGDAVLAQLTRIPGQAQEFFTSRDPSVTTYWFGEHDWSGSGFESPAALLRAITASHGSQEMRADDPTGTGWTTTVDFLSRALEGLGGNLSLGAGSMSATAVQDITETLGAFAPEIAAGLRDSGDVVAVVGPDGTPLDTAALSVHRGNLARLLGIACLDPAGLATFLTATSAYSDRVIDHLTGPQHPDLDVAKTYISQVGDLLGLTYASFTLEHELHLAAISDETQRQLDTMLLIAGLVPGVSGVSATTSYLMQVTTVAAGEVAQTMTPGICTQDELDAMIDRGLDLGSNAMSGMADTISERWDGIDLPYEAEKASVDNLAELTDQLALSYSDTASAYSNPTGADLQDVVVAGEGAMRNRRDMP